MALALEEQVQALEQGQSRAEQARQLLVEDQEVLSRDRLAAALGGGRTRAEKRPEEVLQSTAPDLEDVQPAALDLAPRGAQIRRLVDLLHDATVGGAKPADELHAPTRS